jgi:hypothetical protein
MNGKTPFRFEESELKRTFDTETRPLMTREFRDYRPARIPLPRRNHIPGPPRVESSPLAAICIEDLDKTPSSLERVPPPWRKRNAKR